MAAILSRPQCVEKHISHWTVTQHRGKWVRWSTLYSVAAPVMTISFLWAITEISHHPSTLHAGTNGQDVLILSFTIVETVSLNCNVHPLTQQVSHSCIVRYSNADEICLYCKWIKFIKISTSIERFQQNSSRTGWDLIEQKRPHTPVTKSYQHEFNKAGCVTELCTSPSGIHFHWNT